MTTIRTACILATFTAGLFAASAGAQDKTLYQRLGGYDAIAAVTDEFIGRLATDEEKEQKELAALLAPLEKDIVDK